MAQFLQTIADFFVAIFDIVMSLIRDIIEMIKMLGQFLTKIPDLFQWLPSAAVGMIVTIFGIVVIYKVLGREG